MTTHPDLATDSRGAAPSRLRRFRREREPRSIRFDQAMSTIHRQFLYVRMRLGHNAPVVGEWQSLRDAAWAAETATDPAARTAVVDRWKELTESTRGRRGGDLVTRAANITVDVAKGEHRHTVYERAHHLRWIRFETLVAHGVVTVAVIAAWAWPLYLHSGDLGWVVDPSSYDTTPDRLRTGMRYALWLAVVISTVFAVAVSLFAAGYVWGNRRARGDRLGAVAASFVIELLCSCLILMTAALFLAVPA